MTLHAPQITLLVFLFALTLIRASEYRRTCDDEYTFTWEILKVYTILFILYWGGFFSS